MQADTQALDVERVRRSQTWSVGADEGRRAERRARRAGGSCAVQRRTAAQRIAEAAAEITATRGFAQATIRKIADAAGLPAPTLSNYVASKQDLLEHVHTTSMDRPPLDMAAATAGWRMPHEKIAIAIRKTLARIECNRRHIGVKNCELRSLPPEARARVLERSRVVLDQVAEIVRGR